jgi:hypothetical protein
VPANPEPGDSVWRIIQPQGAIVNAPARRPEITDFLEVQRRMPGIGLEQLEILIRQLLNLFWKPAVMIPKLWQGFMFQSG